MLAIKSIESGAITCDEALDHAVLVVCDLAHSASVCCFCAV
jgi:hypothetical protein